MRNILKTIIAIPIILLIISIVCATILLATFLSYLVAIVYLPLKTYGYMVALDEYKRIKQ